MTSGSPNNPLAAFMAVPQALAKAQIELASNAAQAWFRLFSPGAVPSPAAIAEAIIETEQQVAEALNLQDAPLSTDRAVHGQPPAPPAPVSNEAPPAPVAQPAAPAIKARPAPKAAIKAAPKAAGAASIVAGPAPAPSVAAKAEPKPPAKAKPAKAPDLVPESALAFDDAFVTPRMPPLLDAPEGQADDFAVIKGIGPKLSKLLNELGIYHYRQVALWTPEEIAWINDKLDFKGRVQRERWVQQARALAGLA